MRKSRYGEETVVIRIPVSAITEVKKVLLKYSVIDVSGSPSSKGSSQKTPIYIQGYKDGFREGFERGEEFQYCLQLELSGKSRVIPKLISAFRSRVPGPEILSSELLEQLLSIPLDIHLKQFTIKSLFDRDNKSSQVKGISSENVPHGT